MASVILRLSGVSKFYGKTKALDAVSLDIHEGEFFFILGPSGCGKTTLLKIISGLNGQDEGMIALHGEDLAEKPAHKRDINTVFQNYALFPHLSVYDNVAFGLRMKKFRRSEIAEKVVKMLNMVQLNGFERRKPHTLSGGQQQRIALARALVNEPALLLLDEPLGALDVKLRRNMQRELKSLQQKLGTTFVCVTHDQEEALSMADRIAVMDQGKVLQVGTPEEIYYHPANHFVAGFMGDMNILGANVIGGQDDLIEAVLVDGTRIRAHGNGQNTVTAMDLGVRPECIRISKNEPSPQRRLNVMEGVLKDTVFTGCVRYHVFKTNSGVELKVMVQNLARPERREDIPCFASWSAENTMLLPR